MFRIFEVESLCAERISAEHLPDALDLVQGHPHSNDELRCWQVDVGDHLGAGMLDLQSRV